MRKLALLFALLLLSAGVYAQAWQYGLPFDTSAPSPIFKHVQNNIPRTFMLDSLAYPYPTTTWFKNLYWSSLKNGTHPDSLVGCNPVFTYPYTAGLGNMPRSGWTEYKYAHKRLGFGYRPWAVEIHSTPAPSNSNITFASAFDWYYGAMSTNGKPDSANIKPFIRSWDDASVTVRWREASPGNGYMEAPLVKGMPYVTMKYSALVPYVASQARVLQAISADDGAFITIGSPYLQVTGKKFVLRLGGDGGPDKFIFWVLYVSSPVTVHAYANYKASNSNSEFLGALIFTAPFNGYLRSAYICAHDNPGGIFPNYNDSVNVPAKIALLDKYAGFYPVSGTFSASVESGGNTVQMNIAWQTNQPSNDSLLLLALPHHLDILDPAIKKDTVLTQYKAIYGPLTGVFGKNWAMTDELIPYDWQSNVHNLSTSTSEKFRDQLLAVLKGDVDTILGAKAYPPGYLNQVNPSTYFGGKELAKRGRLAVISDELGTFYNTVAISKEIRDTLKVLLNRWLDAKGLVIPGPAWESDTLLYETRYGGLINSLDYRHQGADFQNSVYTDHHFHYGYFLYAAAALAKVDTAWARTYKSRILLFARDIANPSVSDRYFTRARSTDFFDGHSWAQGLDEGGALGNNQESTSEAANAWYGMYLLGIALNDDNLKNTGRLLLACETRAAKKYWQTGMNSGYPTDYTKYYKVIGNLYASKVTSTVNFGTFDGDPRMVYGIQQIPVSPVNYYLLDRPWCDTIYGFYYRTSDMITNPGGADANINYSWAGINFSSIAIVQPGLAYNYFHSHLNKYIYDQTGGTRNIVNYDDGQSKTNILYNALVSAPSNLLPGKINFEVNVEVLSNDTLGLCKGSIRTTIPNLTQGVPPFYYYLFDTDGPVTVTPDGNGEIHDLCAGTYTLFVTDQEFNEGSAEFTINYPAGVDPKSPEMRLLAYPNPSADGKFHVEWSGRDVQAVRWEVTDPSGNRQPAMRSEVSGPGRMDVVFTEPVSGLYILTIYFDNGSVSHTKLTVVK